MKYLEKELSTLAFEKEFKASSSITLWKFIEKYA